MELQSISTTVIVRKLDLKKKWQETMKFNENDSSRIGIIIIIINIYYT